jgi:hypothetical protein
LLLHGNLCVKISAREIVCMHEIVIAVIHLETNHVIKQYPWCNSLSFTTILWWVFFFQIHAKRTNWEMWTSYDGAKGTSPSKINGNGWWARKIVSVCISACDQFTFIYSRGFNQSKVAIIFKPGIDIHICKIYVYCTLWTISSPF